jgi:hypothetical protein
VYGIHTTARFVRWISRSNRRGTFQFGYLCQTDRVEGKAKPENKTLAGFGSISLKPILSTYLGDKPDRFCEVFAELSLCTPTKKTAVK